MSLKLMNLKLNLDKPFKEQKLTHMKKIYEKPQNQNNYCPLSSLEPFLFFVFAAPL